MDEPYISIHAEENSTVVIGKAPHQPTHMIPAPLILVRTMFAAAFIGIFSGVFGLVIMLKAYPSDFISVQGMPFVFLVAASIWSLGFGFLLAIRRQTCIAEALAMAKRLRDQIAGGYPYQYLVLEAESYRVEMYRIGARRVAEELDHVLRSAAALHPGQSRCQ